MNVLRYFFFTFVIFLIAFAAHASENVCHSLSRGEFDLEILDGKNNITYDFEQSAKDITNIQKQNDLNYSGLKGDSFYNQSGLVLTGNNMGLTVGTFQYLLYLTPYFENIGTGRYCPGVKRICVKFMYDSKIYIAKEYTGNQCAFNKIMNHEMEHHKTNVRNKQKYIGWLRKDMVAVANSIVEKYQPINEEDIGLASDSLQAELKDAIDAYIYKMQVDTNRENQKLDMTSEYLRLTREIKKCYKPSDR